MSPGITLETTEHEFQITASPPRLGSHFNPLFICSLLFPFSPLLLSLTDFHSVFIHLVQKVLTAVVGGGCGCGISVLYFVAHVPSNTVLTAFSCGNHPGQ